MTTDRPVLGILLMVGFCVLAPMGDAIAKILGQTWQILPLLLARFVIQFVVLLPLCMSANAGRIQLSARGWRLTFVRTLLHIAGIAVFFEALRHLPLADAVAIAYVMPFILLLMGRVFLDEEVGLRRLAACVVGFSGTLMVVQPSFAEVGPVALLPIAVAFIFALFMIFTRKLAHETDPVTLQTVGGGIATVMLIPVAIFWTDVDPIFAAPGFDYALILALGLMGTCAHLILTWSLRFAPASTVAPIQYLEIPFAASIGWLVFRDFPNGLALIGIMVTMGAGLYVIAREQQIARAAMRQSSSPAPPAAE